jgi:hypothetical protein
MNPSSLNVAPDRLIAHVAIFDDVRRSRVDNISNAWRTTHRSINGIKP